MSKVTNRKLNRMFSEAPGGAILKKDSIDEPIPRDVVGNCFVCGNPIEASVGQRVRFHKECRKKGRKIMKKHFKNEAKNNKSGSAESVQGTGSVENTSGVVGETDTKPAEHSAVL